MIDEWCVDTNTDDGRYRAIHTSGVRMIVSLYSAILVPEGSVLFYVTYRPSHVRNYKAIIKEAFSTAVFDGEHDQFVFIGETDFALIKLAST